MKNERIKKILKIILILVVIFLIVLLVNTIRNFVIISNLQNKISNYTNSTNFIKYSNEKKSDNTVISSIYYQKGNNQALFLENDTTKISAYFNGERTDRFIDTPNSKTLEIDQISQGLNTSVTDYLKNNSKFKTFINCITVQISSKTINNTNCFEITNFNSDLFKDFSSGNKLYIDKETGLCIEAHVNGSTFETKYDFDNVDDSIFIEPDISQYTIK